MRGGLVCVSRKLKEQGPLEVLGQPSAVLRASLDIWDPLSLCLAARGSFHEPGPFLFTKAPPHPFLPPLSWNKAHLPYLDVWKVKEVLRKTSVATPLSFLSLAQSLEP